MGEAVIKSCPRCGWICRAEASGNQAARPVRKSADGMCLECVVWAVILSLPLNESFEPATLLHQPVQQQFAVILRVGDADPEAHNINWHRLVDNALLPFPAAHEPARW